MRNFEYFEPTSLQEAVGLLQRYGENARMLAGGTDLLIQIRERVMAPDQLINIKKIPGIDELHYDPQTGLHIGALTTTRQVETSPVVAEHYASLGSSVTNFASIQVRNRATVVGNVCRASPSADSLPPLIADGAVVEIYGPRGTHTMLVEDFCLSPGKTRLQSDELVSRLIVPAPVPNTHKVYLKHGRRVQMELATVGVAVSLTLDGPVCRQASIVLAAVAPVPLLARNAESLLIGQTLDTRLIEAAAQAAMDESRPISDVRASAAYRRQMVKVLTRRAIQHALEESK